MEEKLMMNGRMAIGASICAAVLVVAPVFAADGETEFLGSKSCEKCHTEEYRSWKRTFHSMIVQTREAGILKEVVAKWATDGKNPGPTTANVTGTPARLNDVRYVIGSLYKQRFLVKDEQTGGLQFLDKQYNRMTGEWEKFGNKSDWNTNCGTCHTTGYRIVEADKADGRTVRAKWSELSIGCEACHGPGARHVKAAKKDKIKSIFNPARVDMEAQSRVCGYCHTRVENEMYRTAQGDPREDLPAPKPGDSYHAGDDWTKWYPEHVIIPGVQANKPFDAEYQGNLKGVFKTDDFARANGIFEEGKHHEQYQGFIQSRHFKSGQLSCITCHSPHAGKGKKMKTPGGACARCHDASYTVEKYMPRTGKITENLFVRSHTFSKNPRKGGKGASDMGPPEFFE
jgi:hypothetical protein